MTTLAAVAYAAHDVADERRRAREAALLVAEAAERAARLEQIDEFIADCLAESLGRS